MTDNRDIENVDELPQSSHIFVQANFFSLSAPLLVLGGESITVVFLITIIYIEHVIAPWMKFLTIILLLLLLILLLVRLIMAKRRAMWLFIGEAQKEQVEQKRIYVALSSSQFAEADDLTASDVSTQQVQEALAENESQLYLGVPGAGKTISLQVRQYEALKRLPEMMRGESKVPIFIFMKDYNAFLNTPGNSPEPSASFSSLDELPLLSYLVSGASPGTKHIRRYMRKWMKQGRLLLLCDGLNEINATYQALVCAELLYIMQHSKNQVVMTCRELDYNDPQKMFRQLVGGGLARRRLLRPLRPDMIKEFINKYVEEFKATGKTLNYTADEVLDLIERTRLRYECTNPLMLATLIEVINNSAYTDRARIDTRGKLLRAWIASLIERELARDAWQSPPFQPQDIILLFSQVAYIARRRNRDSRNALPLGSGNAKRNYSIRELANELDRLLADPRGPDSTIMPQDHVWKKAFSKPVLEKMLQFAQEANIITFSSGYLLSFRHELIAEYFVAEYLDMAYEKLNRQKLPFGVALIQNVSDWKEPIRNWAGLMDNPVSLTHHLAQLGLQNQDYGFNALTLSLLCVGTRLGTVEDQAKTRFTLPESVKKLFVQHTDKLEKLERLAKTIDECAQEGGTGVYQAFLPMLDKRNIDKILLKLDRERVPEVLFEHMSEIIDKNAQINILPHVIDILGKFGSASLPLAIKYSQSGVSAGTSNVSQQMRKAAIDVLGRTGESAAVAPLMLLLNENTGIRNNARDALIRLGPDLVLQVLLNRLASHIPGTNNEQVHFALLEVVEHFLIQGRGEQSLSETYRQATMSALLPVLSLPYSERIQQFASTLLLREVQTPPSRRDQAIEMLIEYLASKDSAYIKEILSHRDTHSIPLLLRCLRQSSSETHCERIVEVLGMKRDPDAIPALIDLIVTPLPNLRKRVAKTLTLLQPGSVQALITVVLQKGYEEAIEAQKILQMIGRPCVTEVCDSLNPIVPGRTQLLVEVLAHVHDADAIPYLTFLLGNTLHDDGLAITTIHTLDAFADQRVVAALLEALDLTSDAVYDEATKALSQLGMTSFPSLVAALDVDQETLATPGVRDALIHIKSDPYPYMQLLSFIEQSSKAQEQQIMRVFLARGADAAPFLVERLCFQHERVRRFIHQAVNLMPPDDCLPALLHAVGNANCRDEVSSRLHKHHQATIPRLVQQLENNQYGAGSAEILVEFGPKVIPHLLPGLESGGDHAGRLARQVMSRIARQHPEIVPEIILLFRKTSNSPGMNRAYQSLVIVLAQSLADLSISHLLEGLASDHALVREGVKDALVQLAGQGNERSKQVLDGLAKSLEIAGRRNDAIKALLQIGNPAIPIVNELIIHDNPAVREAAILIMSKLPEGALPTIYEALKDVTRREAAHKAFRMMHTSGILKPLIDLLASDDLPKVLSATTLLLQRLIDDIDRPDTDKRMLPALLEYLQQHGRGNDAMHIVIFLLLLPKDLLLIQTNNMLYRNPVLQEWLTPFILLLDMRDSEVKNLLMQRLGNVNMSAVLRAQILGLLGMIDGSRNSLAIAKAVSINQLAVRGKGSVSPEELMDAQHALGGLLMSNRWNRETLLQLRQPFEQDTYIHELYSILLGESYVPRIMGLRGELRREQMQIEAQNQEIANLRSDINAKDRELDQALRENRNVRSQLTASENSIRELRVENTQLKGQNITYENQIQAQAQRIHELEQILLRSLQSA